MTVTGLGITVTVPDAVMVTGAGMTSLVTTDGICATVSGDGATSITKGAAADREEVGAELDLDLELEAVGVGDVETAVV